MLKPNSDLVVAGERHTAADCGLGSVVQRGFGCSIVMAPGRFLILIRPGKASCKRLLNRILRI